MSVQHKSLLAEILFVLGRASTPLSSSDLYERCDLADKPEQISKALYEAAQHGKIVRAAGEGRARYTLPDGVAAPAPAGKAGRPVAAAPAAVPDSSIKPAMEIPTLGDAAAPARKKPGPKPKAAPADPIPQAGKMVESSAEDLADAILEESRKTLQPRWTIDQAGAVRIFNESGFGVLLHPIQARMMAEVVMATHAVLDELV